jgi:phage/plasmid primase-like uncharacterized protein
MKLAFKVTAQELLNAGAPLTAIRQSYRSHDVYDEQVIAKKGSYLTEDGEQTTVTDAKVIYKAVGSARDNFYYTLPAKDSAGEEVEFVEEDATKKVIWGGSIKDSYVLVS